MKAVEAQIEQLLLPFPPSLAKLAQQLRVFLKTTTQPHFELVIDSTNSLNFGYGFTRKAWDCYCAIIVYSKHINFSFLSGAELTDPQQLLRGEGKRVRYLRITDLELARSAGVRELLAEARERAYAKVVPPPEPVDQVETFVKSTAGPKRRP